MTSSERRRWSVTMAAVSVVVCVNSSACIIPDKEIDIVREGNNASPVRLVEPTPLTEEARCACQPSLCSGDSATPSEAQCPQPTTTGLPHLLDPTIPLYEFCSCLPGEQDSNRLSATQLWVEDQDDDDEVFAAVFLDLPGDLPTTSSPLDYLNYTSFINPDQALTQISSPYDQVEFREKPNVRQLNLVTDPLTNKFDLCNPDGDHINKGWHTLTVMVTDRPWFTVLKDDVEFPYVGVPDIAEGATFDTAHYSFFCYESGDPDTVEQCGCEAVEED